MKDVLVACAVIALSLGVVGGVVFGLNDAETFVSPPNVVGEEFVRALGHGRIEPARSMLASDLKRTTSAADVRAISSRLRSRIGYPDHVKGSVTARGADTAAVGVHVKGRRADTELPLSLVREKGSWRVARAADMDRALDSTSARGARQR